MFWKVLIVLLSIPASAISQQIGSSKPCSLGEVKAFDFQVGVWREVNGSSVHRVKKILHGCIIQELWEGGTLNDAIALKSYDKGSQKWYLSWVSSALIHQLWEGRKENGQWRFYREWLLDGKPIVSRTYWNALTDDRVERIVEQSRDGGKTWSPHVRVLYQRATERKSSPPVN